MRSSRIDRSFGTGPQVIFLLLLLVSLTLSGCGGGGGGASTPAPQDEMPPPQDEMPPPQDDELPPQDEPPPTVQQPPQKPVRQPSQPTNQQSSQPPEPCFSTFAGCLTEVLYKDLFQAIKTVHTIHPAYSNQWGLDKIKAADAWSQLQLKYGPDTVPPGDGITPGAIDTGIDENHPVFAGKTVTEELLLDATKEDGSSSSHGTAVASVMVANPDLDFVTRTDGALGVAWGADITMFAIRAGSGGGGFVPVALTSLKYWDNPARQPSVIKAATGWSSNGRSLDFVNVSLGFRSIINMYSKSDLASNLGNHIDALKQSGSSSKTVFVWAAGNSHGRDCDRNDFPAGHENLCDVNGKVNAVSPGVLAGLPVRIPELRENHIAVVAVDRNGDIASFSNRCGIAADWCIAAPGVQIRSAYFGPYQGQNAQRGSYGPSGTSFAAPMVTGGLAVMKHFFRSQLSNAKLVERLYKTAKKTGIHANKSIYGQGLMDLNAAVTPDGITFVASGNRVNDGGISLDGTSVNLGAAFGDGLTRSFANQEIVAFDQLGAPFWYSLDSLASTRSGPSIQSRLTKFMSLTENDREFGIFRPTLGALPAEHSNLNSNRFSLELMDTPDLVNDGGHLSLLGRAIALNRSVSDKLGFSLFSSEGNGDQARVAGMEFVSRPSKRNIALRSGVVAERQSLLRSSAAGAFGRMSGNSVFAGLEGNLKVGSWHLSAGAEVGTAIANIDESLLSVKSPLTTSAFAFRARTKLNERDTLNFALSQPVRIESGRAEYTIPVGRTVEGDVLKSSYSADLKPSGRQIDLAMQWRRALPSGNGDFRLAAGLSFHPGHSDAAEPTISILAGWRLGF